MSDIVYQLYYIGGPLDGTFGIAYRPYCEIGPDERGNVYKAKGTPDEYIQWVDDKTRRIDLYHTRESSEDSDNSKEACDGRT